MISMALGLKNYNLSQQLQFKVKRRRKVYIYMRGYRPMDYIRNILANRAHLPPERVGPHVRAMPRPLV